MVDTFFFLASNAVVAVGVIVVGIVVAWPWFLAVSYSPGVMSFSKLRLITLMFDPICTPCKATAPNILY